MWTLLSVLLRKGTEFPAGIDGRIIRPGGFPPPISVANPADNQAAQDGDNGGDRIPAGEPAAE